MWHPRAATTTIDGADVPLEAAGRGALRLTSPTALVAALVVAIALVCRFALGIDLTPGTALAGLLVGTLVGMTGMGSGALMAPILILLVGVAPMTAVGTDLAYASITKLVGSLQHHRQRTVDFGLARSLAFGSVPGALVAVEALDWLRGRYPIETINALLLRSLGFTLTLSAVALWLAMVRRRQQRRGGALPTGASLATWKAIAIGAPVGFLVGLTSVGSGSIFVVLLSFLTPLAAPVIVGTD
ncbi:MAG: sulfite exporter TauE/SafE family protein, partial [Thermomicrobiaceae bacterium]|nr:sulfite exporter TauE/SafE family protein [Thermomicrobiaceae bacterium]